MQFVTEARLRTAIASRATQRSRASQPQSLRQNCTSFACTAAYELDRAFSRPSLNQTFGDIETHHHVHAEHYRAC